MPKKSIRFGVVDGCGFRAATWNLTVSAGEGPSEVYLSCRELKGAIHTSFHPSGKWHATFTQKTFDEDIKDVSPPDANRFIQKWQRPPEVKPGITLALKIITPWNAVQTEIVPGSKKFSEIKSAQVLIVFLNPNEKIEITNFDEIGRLELNTGEIVVVLHHEIQIPKPNIPKESKGTLVKGRSKEDLESDNVKGLIFADEPNGTRVLWDCAVESKKTS